MKIILASSSPRRSEILKKAGYEFEVITSDFVEIKDGKNPAAIAQENALGKVTDPFYTTRTIRKVGMGIPLLKLAAEQAGGELTVVSKTRENDPVSHGTEVKATFCTDSIDFTPVGDMAATLCVLIQGHPDISYVFRHKTPELDVSLDTSEMREVLGEGISLGEPEILEWIAGYLRQQYNNE